jgi:energy-coupling factor transporter transmembrane protein EcfT
MNGQSRAPAAKLIGLLVLLVFAAAAPLLWTFALFPVLAVVGVIVPIQWRRFVRRLAPIIVIAGVMGIGAFWSHSGASSRRPLEAAVRAVVAGCVLAAFGETTSLIEVIRGMRALGTPALLTSALGLMLRSIDVLGDEREALLRSRAARGGERASRWDEWRGRAGLIGILLMRAVDRAERVHRAMKARGWSAEPKR